jgi:hypothetical protein
MLLPRPPAEVLVYIGPFVLQNPLADGSARWQYMLHWLAIR